MQSLFRDHLFIVPIHGECTQEYEVKYLALLIMLQANCVIRYFEKCQKVPGILQNP